MEVQVRGIPVHVRLEGAGRPVLMLHGWPGDHRFMVHHFEPIFAKRDGWRRIYLDMPGMGRTPAPEWIGGGDDLLHFASDLADALAPGERMVLIGSSWGAYLGLGLLHRSADRFVGAMFSVPATSMRDHELPDAPVIARAPDIGGQLTPDEQFWGRSATVQTPETLASYRAAVKPGLQAADQAFVERMEATLEFSFDATQLPAAFPAPALIVCGRQDVMAGYRDAWQLTEHFPRGTFAVLDRAGHGLPAEQRPLFRTLTHEWLDRVEEYSAQLT